MRISSLSPVPGPGKATRCARQATRSQRPQCAGALARAVHVLRRAPGRVVPRVLPYCT
jgi:hypothetical protein